MGRLRMYWEHLSASDALILTAIVVVIASLYFAFRYDRRLQQRRASEWHDAYFRRGGLVRTLMSRWGRGPARLTDQRDDVAHPQPQQRGP
jgi:hypothetical protein